MFSIMALIICSEDNKILRKKTVTAIASSVIFSILSPLSPIMGHNWIDDLARSCFILQIWFWLCLCTYFGIIALDIYYATKVIVPRFAKKGYLHVTFTNIQTYPNLLPMVLKCHSKKLDVPNVVFHSWSGTLLSKLPFHLKLWNRTDIGNDDNIPNDNIERDLGFKVWYNRSTADATACNVHVQPYFANVVLNSIVTLSEI